MGWGTLKSKLHEHALYAEQSKPTSTCNGARITTMILPMTQSSPKALK